MDIMSLIVSLVSPKFLFPKSAIFLMQQLVKPSSDVVLMATSETSRWC
jgi:hypothetical protein